MDHRSFSAKDIWSQSLTAPVKTLWKVGPKRCFSPVSSLVYGHGAASQRDFSVDSRPNALERKGVRALRRGLRQKANKKGPT
jgi:hypothetical protein